MKQFKVPGTYRIAASIEIAANASQVWAVVADFSAVDTWANQVTRSYQIGDKSSGVGAQRHCDIQGFGGIDERVTDWIEGSSLSYEVTPLGPLGVSHNRWTIEPLDSGYCKVTTELGYDIRFGLLGRIMHSIFMRRKLEQAFPKSLQALKHRVETGKLVRPRRSSENQPQLAAA